MTKLSLIQMEVEQDLKLNTEKIKKFIKLAKSNFLLFPELALTGYNFSSYLKEEIENALKEIQKEAKNNKKTLLLGAPHYKNEEIYNAIYIINDKKIEIVAEKLLLFPEIDKNFSPGNLRKFINLDGFKAGIIICFELRSPEIARTLVKDGADLLIVFAQWPEERIAHWQNLLKTRAIENQVFVIGINAISKVKKFKIPGYSFVFSPLGIALNEASTKEEIIEISITFDFTKIPYPLKTPQFTMNFNKLKTLEELKVLIEKRRKKGQIMVFTNGCFDIIHAGHVHYLSEARKLGDFLVVGLNSDESIKKIKNQKRPINSEEERIWVLSALECVDYIVLFHEETPERLIKELRPDILVKGADWEEEKIVGAEFVKSYGGKVIRIPFKFQISTTEIIKKILSKYKS